MTVSPAAHRGEREAGFAAPGAFPGCAEGCTGSSLP